MINEEWRDYPGFEKDLEISNLGRVRRKARMNCYKQMIPPKVLKVKYNSFVTSISGKQISLTIKDAVAKAFIPLPSGFDVSKLIVVSIVNNGDFSVDNLRWISVEEFEKSQIHKDTKPKVAKKITRTPDAVIQMRKDGSVVRRYIDIEEVLEVHPVWDKLELLTALTKFLPDAYGYKWKYEIE